MDAEIRRLFVSLSNRLNEAQADFTGDMLDAYKEAEDFVDQAFSILKVVHKEVDLDE